MSAKKKSVLRAMERWQEQSSTSHLWPWHGPVGTPSTFVGSDGWRHRTECRRAVVRSTLCASALAAGSYRVALRITKRLTLDAPSLRKPPRLPPWPGPSGKNAGETRSAVLTPTVAKLVEGRRDREEGKHERPYTDHPQHLCNPDDPRRWVNILSIGSSLTPLRASRGHSCSTPFLLRFRPPRLNDLLSGLRAAPDSASARTYQPREARTRAALRGFDGSIDLQC